MRRSPLALALALVLVAAPAPAPAQNVIGENPVLEAGGTTCAAFAAMDVAGRVRALTAVEPVGGDLPDADPALAAQWTAEVAEACRGHPDRLIADVAPRVLGGD